MFYKSDSLLKTKIVIPPGNSRVVRRGRLELFFKQANTQKHKMILVSARAGSGKTTLIREWIYSQSRPTAWLSLDKNDNYPQVFFLYLYESLKQLNINPNPSLTDLLSQHSLPKPEQIISDFVNAMVEFGKPFLFVIDDYHNIQSKWIHQTIASLAENLPWNAQLIIATRVDPPFPLPRLRARNQLTEIRTSNLRFSPDEIRTFINDIMQIELSADLISSLERSTEGWIAGLQMAAISLKSTDTPIDNSKFIDSLEGSNRFILDFLLEEVLNKQYPGIQEFLLDTSILNSMCKDLCKKMRKGSKYTDSTIFNFIQTTADNNLQAPPLYGGEEHKQIQDHNQAILEYLERANLFVTPLDGERRWYSYHKLFADLLKSTLLQTKSQKEVKALHQSAGQWYRENGFTEEALYHSIASEDYITAAEIIDENFFHLFSRNEVPVFLRWIDEIPGNILDQFPWITIYRAYTLVISGNPNEAEKLMDQLEQVKAPDLSENDELVGHFAAIRAFIANLNNDKEKTVELAAIAQDTLSGSQYIALGLATYAKADVLIAEDSLSRASDAFRNLLEIGEESHQQIMVIPALCELAYISMVFGDLTQAEVLFSKARDRLKEFTSEPSRELCSIEFGISELCLERNQLDKAHDHVFAGLQIREQLGGYVVVGDLTFMRLLRARGKTDEATGVLLNIEKQLKTYDFQISVRVKTRAERVLQWLSAGDLDMASRAAEICGNSDLEIIARARLKLAQGLVTDATDLLDKQIVIAEAGGRKGRLIEMLALRAICFEEQGFTEEAEESLEKSLLLAKPNRYLRVYLNLGFPLYNLLKRTTQNKHKEISGLGDIPRVQQYEISLINAFSEILHHKEYHEINGMDEEKTIPNNLTSREAQVLKLLASGKTNKEIAEELIVAPSTIKQHLKNIYRKLNVNSRTQAIMRGREKNLF